MPLLERRVYQMPVDGRKTVRSVLPSPSKSATLQGALVASSIFRITPREWLTT